jgi:hypothetical protein
MRRLPPVTAGRRDERKGWFGQASDKSSQKPARVSKYRPRLSLEGVSQAAFGVGMDRFGGAVGGGLSLAFSDLLNTHWLLTAVQLNQGLEDGVSLRDTAAYGAYLNQTRRWNWALVGSYVPSFVGIRFSSAAMSPGLVPPPVTLIRQTEQAGTAMVSYAFNRARRVEFQGSVGHFTFDEATYTEAATVVWTVPAAPLMLGSTSAAFVSDTTSVGPTGVVRGERYRMEVAPTFGTIRYVNVLADYRRYIMPVPFYTIAARVLHFGRYGAGADDPRVAPLYVGYPTLVRGYDSSEGITSECIGILSTGCREVEGMLGSRVAVGNLELRFPLLRPFGLSAGMYGPVPVEIALFIDGGLAWRAARPLPDAVGDGAAWSSGLTFRTSALGLGLGQFDIVRPFRGPEAGWVFQFNLAPGF